MPALVAKQKFISTGLPSPGEPAVAALWLVEPTERGHSPASLWPPSGFPGLESLLQQSTAFIFHLVAWGEVGNRRAGRREKEK